MKLVHVTKNYLFVLVLLITACSAPKTTTTTTANTLSNDSLLTLVQYRTFQYFWDGAEPTSGAARERFHADNIYPDNDKHIITSGGTGFGVMAILELFDYLHDGIALGVGVLNKAECRQGQAPQHGRGDGEGPAALVVT